MHTLGWDIVKDQSVWLNVYLHTPHAFVKHKPQEAKGMKDPWFAMLGIL